MLKILFRQKKVIIQLSLVLLLLCPVLLKHNPAIAGDRQKNILIINSYHEGFTWSQNLTDSIIETLRSSTLDISISTEYMDWKNYPSEQNLLHLHDYYKYKYQNKKVDALLVSDDAALAFAFKNRSSLFSNAPIVFCGINQNSLAKITARQTNYTGVLEEIDPSDTINLALHLNPALKNIYVMHDNSESGLTAGEIVTDKINALGNNLNVIPLNNLAYEDILENCRTYDKDSIILVTTYYSDVNGIINEFESVSKELSKVSSVPIYHLYDLGINNGALGGAVISGRLHGKYTAELALRILAGESPDTIPVISPKGTRKVLDYNMLKKFNISEKNIPADFELINKPFSFYQTYKAAVLITLGAFILLCALTFSLLLYTINIRKIRKALQHSYKELTYLAYHDALTGLPNKLYLYENANTTAFAPGNSIAALLFLDIDNFKYVNDTVGHSYGNQLLISVSKRLTSLLDESCTVYRLSGDEFIVICRNVKSKRQAEELASHIISSFREEFNIFNSVIHIGMSIGIVMFPEHGTGIEDLVKFADIATYRAKETGRNRYVLYDNTMKERFHQRVNIEKRLYKAQSNNELSLHYQPQLDLQQNRVTGFEALLRWNNPELGTIPPSQFIKVAEDTHLIIPIGTWVLKQACAFLKELHDQGYTDLSISVNISILQLIQADFIQVVRNTLDELGIKPCHLELEITESMLMESLETIAEKLKYLEEIGIRIALDDFGRGYSSLSYLKQLPISTLKIDKSFIDDITNEYQNETLTGMIVLLGKSMGKCVVAEGVESKKQMDYLLQHECHKVQGYFYSKPLPEGEAKKLLGIM